MSISGRDDDNDGNADSWHDIRFVSLSISHIHTLVLVLLLLVDGETARHKCAIIFIHKTKEVWGCKV